MTRKGIGGQSIELTFGSADGIADAATTELSEIEYNSANVNNTYSVVPSNIHWDGTAVLP